jgi:murein peptide amidase A
VTRPTPFIEVKEWAFSAMKRPIALYKSHENPDRPILLTGGVHGDEPEGIWLAEATLEWLKSNSSNEKNVGGKTQVPWVIIPCINPDGAAKNERVNGHGVDLNRNYPSKSWSPKFEKERYFPGASAASEPEIKSLIALIRQTKPRLLIHCHSWKPCIVFAGEPGLPAARALAECTGYTLKDDIGYPTPGSLSEWGWVDNNTPVICIEESEGTAKKDVWPHFAEGMKKIFTTPEWWS